MSFWIHKGRPEGILGRARKRLEQASPGGWRPVSRRGDELGERLRWREGRGGGSDDGRGAESCQRASIPGRNSQQRCFIFHFRAMQFSSITTPPNLQQMLGTHVCPVPVEPGRSQGKGLAVSHIQADMRQGRGKDPWEEI